MHGRTAAGLGALVLTTLLAAGLTAQEDPAATASSADSSAVADTPAPDTTPAADSAAQPVVHGVLFYSPTCPHCREVMTEALPPVLDRYGDAIQIATVNTTSAGGQALYRAMVEHLSLPRARIGVPTLLVGSQVLVGSFEIPNLLPAIADQALAANGVDWPDIPLIRQALAAQGLLAPTGPTEGAEAGPDAPASVAQPEAADKEAAETETAGADVAGEQGPEADVAEEVTAESDAAEPAPEGLRTAPSRNAGTSRDPADTVVEPTAAADSAVSSELASAIDTDPAVAHELDWRARFRLDPAGNGTAVVMLLAMLGALGLVVADRMGRIRIPRWPSWLVPTLVLMGAAIAVYLAYVEATGAEAICGPVGHCNTVQQSPYARLFGTVPVAALGLVGYGLMGVAWGLTRGPVGLRALGRTTLWWAALGGVLFSLYLTFLEPFVIGASCAWCLTSAALMTLILLAATGERNAHAAD